MAGQRIVRVEIENFRSIRYLAFNPLGLCALVGANNAGKSNILAALEFLLGHVYPTDLRLTESSFFYRESERRLRIKAVLESDVHGEPRETSLEFRWDGDRGGYRLYSDDDPYVRREVREAFPFVRLGVDRGIRQHGATNRWTLLGRLLLEINEEFQRDPVRVERFQTVMGEMRDEVLGSVPGFQALAAMLRDEAARQLNRRVDDVSAELSLHDPWNFYRTLQLVVSECAIRMPADETGMGMQSSLVIAILRCYAKIAKEARAVIAIEEPELFLHPLAQRQFYALLRELAYPTDGAVPLQILYTTHSDAFVDLAYFDEVCLVRRVPDDEEDGRWQTVCVQVPIETVAGKLNDRGIPATTASLRAQMLPLSALGRQEGLFADVVVLVEGETELLTLPVWAQAKGFDFDRANIALLAAGGKSALPGLREVFEQFEIPVYVVADGDAPKGPHGHPKVNRRLLDQAGLDPADFPTTTISDSLAIWNDDYEAALEADMKDYGYFTNRAREELGARSKPVIAHRAAQICVEVGYVPTIMERLIAAIEARAHGIAGSRPSEEPAGGEIPF